MNNITPSVQNKYHALTGRVEKTTERDESFKKQQISAYDLPIYRKHSASRHKWDKVIDSGDEDELNLDNRKLGSKNIQEKSHPKKYQNSMNSSCQSKNSRQLSKDDKLRNGRRPNGSNQSSNLKDSSRDQSQRSKLSRDSFQNQRKQFQASVVRRSVFKEDLLKKRQENYHETRNTSREKRELS